VSRTVLIVEDEANLAELLTDMLHSQGYEVVLTTASRAATLVDELAPHAVVLDYLMPGMNGAEVVKEVRRQVGTRMPPVMLVSGLSNVAELAHQAGADAYLRKPFDVDAFLRVIDRLSSGDVGST
jgi:two-component system phosphate regulon response regulator PhoB